tara:strand:- start:365 stop:529 length:165 start_codon:yes stop_codon:yes gene_type:complete
MNKKRQIRDSNIIIDMNDIKGLFREWMIKKMDEDFEGMVRLYMTDKIENKTKII